MQQENNRGSTLVRNAFILSMAAVLSKVIGAFYQSFLYYNVGSAGVGLYIRGFNVYTMLLAISAAGIPVAVSKLMAEELAQNRVGRAARIFKISLFLLAFLGVVVSGLLYFLAPVLGKYAFQDMRVVFILQALAPALLIVSIMAVFRGYFQGKQNMAPVAYSQIIEQIGRVGFSILVTIYLVKTVTEGLTVKVINGVAFGPFLGALLGLILLLFFFRKEKFKFKNKQLSEPQISNKSLLKKIVFLAFPITISALLPTLVDNSGSIIIPNSLLNLGFSQVFSDGYLGSFSGAVMGLINLVTLVAASFAISLVPAISEAKIKKNQTEIQSRTAFSLKLVSMISIPAAAIFIFLGGPILQVIFNDGGSSRLLIYSILLVVFIGLYHATTGILQGLGKTYIPLISLSIGLVLNIILLKVIFSIPSIYFLAAPIAYTVAYVVAFSFNLYFVKKETGVVFKLLEWLPQTFLSSLGTGIVAFAIYQIAVLLGQQILSGTWLMLLGLGISMPLGLITYLLLMILFKGLRKEEALMIPKLGHLIVKVGKKIGRF